VAREAHAIVFARVRTALIGMMKETRLWAAMLQRHVERAEYVVPIVHRADRPADHEARIEVENGGEIQLGAAPDDELCRVTHPALIWTVGSELAGEDVGGDRLVVVTHRRDTEALAHASAKAFIAHQPRDAFPTNRDAQGAQVSWTRGLP
jgi:hypothetical protein